MGYVCVCVCVCKQPSAEWVQVFMGHPPKTESKDTVWAGWPFFFAKFFQWVFPRDLEKKQSFDTVGEGYNHFYHHSTLHRVQM